MDSGTSTEKKRRLSLGKMLGRRDKDPPNKHHSNEAPSSHSNVADSAYASSENTEPVKNTGQFEGVSSDRNLTLNKNTGDVRDDDTGEVVSTVTTTTTTTTTTTMKTGKDGKKTTIVSTTPGEPTIQEMPADNLTPQATSVDQTTPQSTSPAPPPIPGPEVPYRNPNRKSGEYPPYRKSREFVENPVSPIDSSRHNFSYPSRSNMREGMDDANDKRPLSTIESLKKAAIGIHGVGETLRGTLNNEVDSRFSRSNPEKAAQANAKNQATLQAGEREMAGLRDRAGLQTTVAPDHNKNLPYLPHQPNYTYHPNAPQQNMTALPIMKDSGGYVAPHGTAVPQENYYDNQDSGSYQTSADSYDAPGSSAPVSEKKGGFRKLIKRRP